MITREKLGENCEFCGGIAHYTLDTIKNDNGFNQFSYCEKCKEKIDTSIKDTMFNRKKEELNRSVNFSLRSKGIQSPKEMVAYLDRYVVGQYEAKKALVVAVYNHFKSYALYNFKHSEKSENANLPDWVFTDEPEVSMGNLLMIGPPGSGKTLMLKILAKHYNLPIVIVDANTLTGTGHSGANVSSIIDLLIQKAKETIHGNRTVPRLFLKELVESGIVYIDQVDKILSPNQSITTGGVQEAFLAMLEGSLIPVTDSALLSPHEKGTTFIDTSQILFIAGGSFIGLNKIINKRECGVGFMGNVISINRSLPSIDKVTHVDLITMGFIPEFIARFQTITILDELSERQLKEVLVDIKNSLISEYKELFKLDGCELTFTNGAIDEVVKQAILKRGGARSLRSVLEQLLLDDMFSIPHNYCAEIKIYKRDVQKHFKIKKLCAVA